MLSGVPLGHLQDILVVTLTVGNVRIKKTFTSCYHQITRFRAHMTLWQRTFMIIIQNKKNFYHLSRVRIAILLRQNSSRKMLNS